MTDKATELAELEERARVLRTEVDAEKRAKAAAVKPDYMFTVQPIKNDNWTPVYDDTCCLYFIEGWVRNKAELEAAGNRVPITGGMKFYFNKATGKLIGSVGGGTTYIGSGHPEIAQACYGEVSAFIVTHPDGGEITQIMNKYRK